MNFDKIKEEMEDELKKHNMTYEIDLTRGKQNPVQAIRTTMKVEIIYQLLAIGCCFLIPFYAEMHTLAKAVYFIFMFLIMLMTLGYLIKLGLFLKKTSDLTLSTREVISQFIMDTKLTMEVYRAYMISGSLLLPFVLLALSNGNVASTEETLFNKLFALDFSLNELLILAGSYLLIAFITVVVTFSWADGLYMTHIRYLEALMEELE